MGLGYQVSFDALSLGFEGRLLLSLPGSNAYRTRPLGGLLHYKLDL
jgi:hypothetical protein